MPSTYNPWLVCLSVVVAIAVSYTALQLAGRVADEEGSRRPWLIGGAMAMGIGIWSMHFIGMLAFSVPIPLQYNVPITVASLLIAILTSAFALAVASHTNLGLRRLTLGAVFMGAGICTMHYTGMAAIQVMPAIHYDPALVAASALIAVSASFVALWLFFQLRHGRSWKMILVRGGAAIVMGIAISGMHYTGMAASMLAPDAYCTGGRTFDNAWLAVIVALVSLTVLAIMLLASIFDAHLKSSARRSAQRLERLNSELQQGKRLLTLATQAAGIACWEYDALARRVLWTENEIDSLTQLGINLQTDPAALLSRLHPDDTLSALRQLHTAARERREVVSLRVRVRHEAQVVHLQIHARLFCDAEARITRLLGICWDVTDEVTQQALQAELQLQLRDASRQAGMAEVAAGVLHNIGNALNSLGVSAAVLQTGLRDSRAGNVQRVATLLLENSADLGTFLTADGRGREVPGYLAQLGQQLITERVQLHEEAKAVAAHIEHIARIVAAQQTYARHSDSGDELDLSELVDQTLTLNFSNHAELRITRQFDPLPRIIADRHRIMQILTNLVTNARHALRGLDPAGQLLTVRILGGEPGWFSLEVQDSGIGMSPEVLARLFEFGFTTKKTGHGFGLHASANMAREMGGALTARSDGPGTGSCFCLRLPLRTPAQEGRRRA